MTFQNSLSTFELREIFADEITKAGGSVSETFNDGKRLFCRSVLPGRRSVQRADDVQGGVALRATEEEILVHPYTFRLICRNGAVRAHAVQTMRVDLGECDVQLEIALREAVRACCGDEAFLAGVEEMRSTLEQEADVLLIMSSLLSRVSQFAGNDVVMAIMRQYLGKRDQTGFGLMNAVTAVARDQRDPEVRWRLEELGGGVPALIRAPKDAPPCLAEELLTA